MKSRQVNMLSGSITKGLLALTLPVMIRDVLQTMLSVIDMAVLGNLVDDDAVGAVGACGALIILVTGLLIGIATGANVVVAKHIGRGDKALAGVAAGSGVAFSVISGIALMIFGIVFAEPMLEIASCPGELFSQATVYLRLYFCGVPSLLLYNFAASALSACGDTRRPMFYLLSGGVLKIGLNIGFIILFDLTVEGVAYATIISNTFVGVLTFVTMFRVKEQMNFGMRNVMPVFSELKKILFIGVPSGIQRGLYSVANLVIAATVNKMGPDATTGLAIANQYDGILYAIACAASVAITPYVAQNIGAGNFARARESVKKSIIITIVIAGSLGCLSAVFSGQLSLLMTSSPAVIGYSRQKMMIISSTYFICGINEIMCGTLRGIGKPIVPTVATFIYMCVLRFFWVYCIFPLCPNMTFLYLVWPMGWVLSLITLTNVYYARISKMRNEATI